MMIPDVSLGWAVPLYTRPWCHTGPMCTDIDRVIDFDDYDEDEDDDEDGTLLNEMIVAVIAL